MMKELVKSPLSINHYEFMKAFLNEDMQSNLAKLENKQTSETERAQALDALNKALQTELAALNAKLATEKDATEKKLLEANIQKLTNVIDTLSNPDKKKNYDAALENPKSASIAIKYGKDGSKNGLSLVALVPLSEIKSAF